ncbi:spore germination protein (amino acid permease) [Bacillus ectoiniformans]|uniref:GerAB/ArcD/ProY family transporter n=1 Tax=Bacillus ectoiniformans TaxID=1494429 RepID=UPI00195ED282|nr:GerAB/ArcD/ProY family transporter [Bacillus ectoiniformans]MBM7647406.1 spore germination protein (amino acid permease) [Bacillus ectoiniformans]
MLPLPGQNRQVSPFFVFYIIYNLQIGVAVLGFERYIAKSAGHDAWISILLSGASIQIIIWMSYYILNSGKNDIVVIHRQLFGKWLGGLFSLYLIAYIILLLITNVRTYIEVIQIWIFPHLATWYMAIILLALTYMYVSGGFRAVVGICFFGFFMTIPLLALKWFPLQEAKPSYLLPVMDHSVFEIYEGAKTMAFSFAGFEALLFFYPFIKNAQSSQKWAHFGVLFSTFIYLLSAIVSFLYYSQEQLQRTIWATLTLWKVVDLPFIERFEYAGIAIWLFVILPNLCMYTWAASRGVKQLFSIKQKDSLIALLFITLVAVVLITDRFSIDKLNTLSGNMGIITIYLYIPFIFIVQLVKNKMRKSL